VGTAKGNAEGRKMVMWGLW